MLQVRPLSGSAERHVYRDRLIGVLPDAAGHVVWFHAPLGYGKSILAAQWAESLESGGWRVLWTAMLGMSVQQTVATALRLPARAPWAVIQAELAREPTLLVVEDLAGDEELEHLLRSNRTGITLLSSRTRLQEPELLRLHTEGRLLELTAGHLAFTRQEAESLARKLDSSDVDGFWSETAGWPLLLHFAFLTGEAGNGPLHVLLRRSVSEEGWKEALFMAAAGVIDVNAGTETTDELVTSGFLQRLENHYRLHPLLAGHLLEHKREEVRRELTAGIDRLTRMDRARACLRAGQLDLLAAELEIVPLVAVGENCTEYLQLDQQAPGEDSPGRKLRRAYAQMTMQAEARHATALQVALDSAGLPENELFGARVLASVMFARVGNHELAGHNIEAAQQSLPAGPSLELARLLAARVLLHGYAGRYSQALADADRAEEMALGIGTAEGREVAASAQEHATTFRFELNGDPETEADIVSRLAARPNIHRLRRSQLLFNVGVNRVMNLQDDLALEAARECRDNGEPFWRLWSEVLIAYITADLDAFPELYRQAGNWGMNDTLSRVAALWLRACRKVGDLETPARIEARLQTDPFVCMELALHRLATGRQQEAEELLESARDGYGNREFRQHFYAASYLISGNESDLDALLELSVHPEKLVRYVLLPLDSLPRNRPELAVEYPLSEVLASGWKEAIAFRRSEIPRLSLEILGEFRVSQLGKELQLSTRQKQIITLLALGYSKERVATEVWPESPADKSGNNLNVQLHLMRKTLEPWGLQTYLSDGALTHTDVDLLKLRQALEQQDAAAALRLYRGDLAPELDTEALVAERDSLRREVLQLLTKEAAASKPVEALPLLERTLEIDPLHEQAVALLASKLIQLGRRSAAHKRVAEFSDMLALETGLRPTSELMALLKD